MSTARPPSRPAGLRALGLAALLAALAAPPAVVAAPAKGPPPPATPASKPAAPSRAAYDFSALDARLAAGDWQGAATDAEAILSDVSLASAHPGALARLGKAMVVGNLPYAGLALLVEASRQDPAAAAPFYGDLLALTEKLREHTWVGGITGADFSAVTDAEVRSHLALVAARHHFDGSSWATATSLLGLVDKDGPWGLDAQILQGLALAQQGRYTDALEPLLEARDRARQAPYAGTREPHADELLDLNIARTFYGAGNYGRAMEFYARVDREDPAWAEAHFERAWAHFMVNDMNGVLGLLMTHTSPFFEGWYFPEAELLRAQALFLMCKFPDAGRAIDEFQASYRPVLDATRAAAGALTPAEAFADAKASLSGGTTRLPRILLSRFGWDQRLQAAISAIDTADADLGKLERLSQFPFAGRVAKLLDARRDARVVEEGERVLAFASESAAELDGMLTDIELARIDLLSFQADQLEKAAALGKPPAPPPVPRKLRKDKKKATGKQIWPFEGEYWADELGWFRVNSRPECPPELQRTIGGG